MGFQCLKCFLSRFVREFDCVARYTGRMIYRGLCEVGILQVVECCKNLVDAPGLASSTQHPKTVWQQRLGSVLLTGPGN